MREDWIECKAEDFGELIRGITYNKNQASDIPKDNYLPLLRANNINDNKLNFDDIKYVEESLINDFQKIIPNDILIAMSSGSKHLVGKSAQSKGHYEGSFGAFCAVFRPNQNLSGNYVSYFFQSNDFRKNISEISKGSNINNLKREHILEFVFPIAPLPIQRAIVSKIEALFSDLDNGIANLKKAQEQLKVYRQAVLKKAFEGELTNTVIENKPLSELSSLITKGASPKWQGFDYTDNSDELLFITSENVREGFISLEKEKYLPIGFNEIQKRSVLKNGDLLFNIVGASIGRAAIFKLDKLANINQAVALIRLNDDVSKQYVNYFLNSEIAKQEYLQKQVDVARANLSLQNVADIEIPFCSSDEQTQIVQEIESRLSVCDKMEQSINESIEKAEALRQSILKKAFEGKLLSEAEIEQCKAAADYEPASKLLKKIQAEKLAKEQEKKKKPTVKKKIPKG